MENTNSKSSNYRKETILSVPFSEKEEAKQLGAKWNPSIKRWFVPAGVNVSDFSRWIKDPEGTD